MNKRDLVQSFECYEKEEEKEKVWKKAEEFVEKQEELNRYYQLPASTLMMEVAHEWNLKRGKKVLPFPEIEAEVEKHVDSVKRFSQLLMSLVDETRITSWEAEDYKSFENHKIWVWNVLKSAREEIRRRELLCSVAARISENVYGRKLLTEPFAVHCLKKKNKDKNMIYACREGTKRHGAREV